MSILFIGLGTMGEPMVRNLAPTFPEIFVHDIAAEVSTRIADEIGATAVQTVSVLPRSVDTVILMVPNSRTVESLLIGEGRILDQLAAGALVIDMSSSEPLSTRGLAADAAEKSIDLIDAPVSGGVAKARNGQLAIMIGATDAAYARALPVLRTMGTSLHHVGSSGAGHAAKALNNLLSATNIAAAAEVLAAATRFGIRPAAMLDVLNNSTGRSQATEAKYPNFVLTRSFASGFGLDLMLKDLAIADALTTGAGLSASVTDAARRAALGAREIAGPGADHTEIVRYYENANNVTIQA